MFACRQERKAHQAAWEAYRASLPEWCAGYTDPDVRGDLLAAVAALREAGWAITESHVGSTYLTKDGKVARVSDHGAVGSVLHRSSHNVHHLIHGSAKQIATRLAQALEPQLAD